MADSPLGGHWGEILNVCLSVSTLSLSGLCVTSRRFCSTVSTLLQMCFFFYIHCGWCTKNYRIQKRYDWHADMKLKWIWCLYNISDEFPKVVGIWIQRQIYSGLEVKGHCSLAKKVECKGESKLEIKPEVNTFYLDVTFHTVKCGC